MKTEMILQLNDIETLDAVKASAKSTFQEFSALIPDTQAALQEVRKLYGENAFVELDYDTDSKPIVHCWIWLLVMGGKEIIGSGETWADALEDAATREKN